MAKRIELRRHTDNDGDVLSPEGVRAAVQIGASLGGPYELMVSSGAQRATQAAGCFLAGQAIDPLGKGCGIVLVLDTDRARYRSSRDAPGNA